MQQFDSGHALALLGSLDPIGETNQVLAYLEWAEQRERQTRPAVGEHVQIERRAVEHVQEAVVGIRLQAEDSDEAGNTSEIGATAEAHQHQDHPEIRLISTKGGS